MRDWDQEFLRSRLSVVGQEASLFARSVRRNIIFGLEGTPHEPSTEAIVAAARQANAHDFIMKMPKKYETLVGERGAQISGGQKQRVALARALCRGSHGSAAGASSGPAALLLGAFIPLSPIPVLAHFLAASGVAAAHHSTRLPSQMKPRVPWTRSPRLSCKSPWTISCGRATAQF